ncbi:MAG: hypothetical protein Q9169_008644, partial [Polycauliona sp. 2 TL-2023]
MLKGRDLTKAEVESIKAVHIGIDPANARAGDRALPMDKKARSDAETARKDNEVYQRLLDEKADDDARYEKPGTNHGLLKRDQLAKQKLQQAALVAPQGVQQPFHPARRPSSVLPQGKTKKPRAPPRLHTTPASSQAPKSPLTATVAQPSAEEGVINLIDDDDIDPVMDAPKGHNTAQHSMAPPPCPVDVRYVVPQVEGDRLTITESLEITREAYRNATGGQTTLTNFFAPYMDQWNEMQQALNSHYMFYHVGKAIPRLIQRPAWRDAWDGWHRQNLAMPAPMAQPTALARPTPLVKPNPKPDDVDWDKVFDFDGAPDSVPASKGTLFSDPSTPELLVSGSNLEDLLRRPNSDFKIYVDDGNAPSPPKKRKVSEAGSSTVMQPQEDDETISARKKSKDSSAAAPKARMP